MFSSSLDKSRPASPARLRLRLHARPASQGAAWTKELETHDGQDRTRTDAQATPEPASRTCHVLRLLSVLESSKPCPHCRQRPGDTPSQSPVTSEGVSWGCLLSGSSGNAGPVSYVMARQGAYFSPLTLSPEEGKAEGIRSCPRCSSSCVLKCSLDKSRPASPARLRLRLHAGLRARGRRGPKNLRHTTGKIEPARTHSHARTCKQNLSCLATVVRAGKLETVPALPSTT